MLKFKSKWFGVSLLALTLPFLLFAYWLIRPPQDPFAADAVVQPPFPSLTYGIQAFLWWDTGHVGLHLDWVRLMSFSHVKQTFSWTNIEPEPGNWLWHEADRVVAEVERRNLKLVARLGQTPVWALPPAMQPDVENFIDAPPADLALWGEFCRRVAERYQGRIAAYQIYNEPNLSREWGNQPPDAAAYVEMLRVCSEAVRAVDPQVILISAGLAPNGQYDDLAHRDDIYLDQMYQAGFQQYVDVVGVHAPGFSAPDYGPDDAERDGQGRWATFRRVEDLRKIMIQHDDAARQMAILEFGWTTDQQNPDYMWYAVDEEEQAQYLLEAYEYALDHWQPWVGLMSVIYLPKPVWTEADEEYWWAISYPQPGQGHREAFFVLANMKKVCGDYVIPERDPNSPEALGLVPADICP